MKQKCYKQSHCNPTAVWFKSLGKVLLLCWDETLFLLTLIDGDTGCSFGAPTWITTTTVPALEDKGSLMNMSA